MVSVKKDLPMVPSPDSVICSNCLLPMYYQTKVNERFHWQCFKCGKKYLITTDDGGNSEIEETWSPPR